MPAKYEEIESKMNKTISAYENELNTVRAGRANPAVLDRILVEYYGTPSPINQIASVSVPDARSILIQPWDASIIGEIEKAINKSDLGINPQNDGKVIRLNFPPLTEERRKDLVKEVNKKGETAKIAIRSIRRDGLEHYKGLKKKSEITEDDLKVVEKDVQTLTDKFIKTIEDITKAKENEIMMV